MSDFVKKCVLNRMKWSACLCLGVAAPVVIMMLIAGLALDVSGFDLLMGVLLPLGEAAIIFVIFLYRPYRFVHMIRRQENETGYLR